MNTKTNISVSLEFSSVVLLRQIAEAERRSLSSVMQAVVDEGLNSPSIKERSELAKKALVK